MTISHDSLVAYAIGGLNLEEEGDIERHLRDHPEDAGLVRGYLDALTALVLSEEPAELPLDGEARLLASIRGVLLLHAERAPTSR